jgi:hypothetical protein
MARPCPHAGEAELLQKLSDVALVEVNAEPLGDDALEVHPSLAHDAVPLAIRPSFDDGGEIGHCAADSRGLGPSVQLSMSPSGPAALKRCAQRHACPNTDGIPRNRSDCEPRVRGRPCRGASSPPPHRRRTRTLTLATARHICASLAMYPEREGQAALDKIKREGKLLRYE